MSKFEPSRKKRKQPYGNDALKPGFWDMLCGGSIADTDAYSP